jgi:hypothetical protein
MVHVLHSNMVFCRKDWPEPSNPQIELERLASYSRYPIYTLKTGFCDSLGIYGVHGCLQPGMNEAAPGGPRWVLGPLNPQVRLAQPYRGKAHQSRWKVLVASIGPNGASKPGWVAFAGACVMARWALELRLGRRFCGIPFT